jgi:hypothetical protein
VPATSRRKQAIRAFLVASDAAERDPDLGQLLPGEGVQLLPQAGILRVVTGCIDSLDRRARHCAGELARHHERRRHLSPREDDAGTS